MVPSIEEKPVEIVSDERTEKKRRMLLQLLGVVDSNLKGREKNGGVRIMTYVLNLLKYNK